MKMFSTIFIGGMNNLTIDKVSKELQLKSTSMESLPNHWEVVKLGNYLTIYSGDSPANLQFNDNGIPYYKVDDLNRSMKYMVGGKVKVENQNIKKIVPKGSLIFPKRGAAILTNKVRILTEDSYFDTNIMGVKVDDEQIDIEFLYYFIIKKGLYKIADTSTIPQLNNKHIQPLLVPKPPINEQRKIATILATWDKAIDHKERMLEEKRKVKRGLMDRLLLGKVRLPGFQEEWIKVQFGDVMEILKKKPVNNPQNYYLLTVKLYVKGIEATDKRPNITTNGRPYYIRYPGELLIGRQNFHNGGIGIVPEEMMNYVASNAISSVHVMKGNLKFYYYYMSNPNFYKRIEHLIGGTGQKEISETAIKQLKLFIPSDEKEQDAITHLLDTADNELNLLEEELLLLKQQKEGLMQLLLTGKVNVPI